MDFTVLLFGERAVRALDELKLDEYESAIQPVDSSNWRNLAFILLNS
jgi:hypothetical protein